MKTKYTDPLLSLGFHTHLPYTRGRMSARKNARTATTTPPDEPYFVMVHGLPSATYAVDEVRQVWVNASHAIDPSVHAFAEKGALPT